MYKSDLKYLLAYLVPLSGFIGFYYQSWWSPGSIYLGFIIIPIIEIIIPVEKDNDVESDAIRKSTRRFFDLLLYINLPLLYFLLGYFIYTLFHFTGSTFSWICLTLNMGVLLGVMGINVAHELGHRNHWIDTWISQLLLLPCLYMHFTLQHNFWHHKYVGTHSDSSTALRDENVYAFWWRSISGGYRHAFQLQMQQLHSENVAFFHRKNNMLIQLGIQFLYLSFIEYIFGLFVLISIVLAALIGILLLETINYIEHYGLLRKREDSGLYERVHAGHSWNSDHALGRIMLYELTRHPHHHLKSNIKYQNLDSLQSSPQLLTGYPGSMLITLIPPLWRRLMNQRLEN
jgi:alkane 1-monooxygenase